MLDCSEQPPRRSYFPVRLLTGFTCHSFKTTTLPLSKMKSDFQQEHVRIQQKRRQPTTWTAFYFVCLLIISPISATPSHTHSFPFTYILNLCLTKLLRPHPLHTNLYPADQLSPICQLLPRRPIRPHPLYANLSPADQYVLIPFMPRFLAAAPSPGAGSAVRPGRPARGTGRSCLACGATPPACRR